MTENCELCGAPIEHGWPVSCLHCASAKPDLTPAQRAADDLLAALKLYQKQHNDDPPNPKGGQCICYCCSTARAAIAEAKGEADD